MADGVDHIDIYADVEEEFSQVEHFLSPLLKMYVFAHLCIGLRCVGIESFRLQYVQMAPIAHGLPGFPSPFTMLPADIFSFSFK